MGNMPGMFLAVRKADAGDVNTRINTTILECISICSIQVVDILDAPFALNHLGTDSLLEAIENNRTQLPFITNKMKYRRQTDLKTLQKT